MAGHTGVKELSTLSIEICSCPGAVLAAPDMGFQREIDDGRERLGRSRLWLIAARAEVGDIAADRSGERSLELRLRVVYGAGGGTGFWRGVGRKSRRTATLRMKELDVSTERF
jgi:hypothetical protein